MNKDVTKLCALYLRLSDEDKGKESKFQESESIKNQKAMLLEYAAQNNLQVYKIYSDDDFSGADISKPRPAYDELLKDAEAGKFSTIICKSQARFTRDMAHIEYYMHNKFLEWGIRFIGVADRVDTNDLANKKTRQITGLTNEWYLEDSSRNIKTAFEIKKKQGQFVGAYPCFGYIRDESNKNKLIIDDEAAEIVRRIFKMYNNGMGCYSIANKLNEECIPTPSMYKYQKGDFKTTRRKGSSSLKTVMWENSSVAYILHQGMYCGDMIQNKEGTVSYKNQKKKKKDKSEWIIVKDTHEAIIDRDTFEKAQVIAGTRQRPIKSGVINPYSGIIRCGECGGVMSRVKGNLKNNNATVGYRCKMNEKAKNVCSGSTITEKKLNSIVINEINKLLDSFYDDSYLINHGIFEDIGQCELVSYERQRMELCSIIELSNKALIDLYLDKVKGIITEEQFIMMNNALLKDLENNNKLISELQQRIDKTETRKPISIDLIKSFKKYRHISEIDREIIKEFISAIYIKNTSVRNQKEVSIIWSFYEHPLKEVPQEAFFKVYSYNEKG